MGGVAADRRVLHSGHRREGQPLHRARICNGSHGGDCHHRRYPGYHRRVHHRRPTHHNHSRQRGEYRCHHSARHHDFDHRRHNAARHDHHPSR